MTIFIVANTNAVAKSGFGFQSEANAIRLEVNTSETGNILDCAVTEVLMEGQVYVDDVLTEEGFSYHWTGPASFESTQKDIVVSVPGWYRFTARDANGLATSKEYIVYGPGFPGDYAGPDLVMYSSDTSLKLQGKAYNFYHVSWEASDGGNIVSGANTYTPTVDAPGTYTISLTSPAGCTMQDEMVVTYEVIVPLEAKIGLTGSSTLECNGPGSGLVGRATVNGEYKFEGISYSWTGPDNFSATSQEIHAQVPGEYILTVTDTTTGHSASASQTVYPPIYPKGSAGPDKQLTCTSPSVQLEGNMERGVHLIWLANEGGHIVSGARTPTPVVDAPGTYILIMDNSINGCRLQDTVVVTREESPALTATGGKLYCASGSVQLTASSDKEDLNYSWTGPDGYTSNEQNPTVTVAGDYTVTVTNPETGCIATRTVVVTPESTELLVERYLIDFNDEKKGLISTINTELGPIAVTGRKRNQGYPIFFAPENHAAIFDSQAPTGDDADLYTKDWGNVLIVNKDLSDVPDDNEWGGELILDFSAIGPVFMESIKVLDIDEYEDESWVYLYDGEDNEIQRFKLKALGNNSQQTLSLGNTMGVMKMKVVLDGRRDPWRLSGSGAIDDIRFYKQEVVASPCQNVLQQEAIQAIAYPTTFSDKATVQFTLQQAGNYTVNLYDMQGTLVKQLKAGTAMANEQVKVDVQGESLREGVYIARIVSDSASESLKLILKH
ncbi:T9SS type A sorting domain-containing protein [Pontibacter korlensis]|uniref:T9SS type A sorting domain-containing protein n=1 Tax=Pontibacter korlensis TaxID=400092 RepID=UPI00130DB01F|nr:T9SS type A sorting domain-containing protein [Pontibacter korlensis]